MNNEMDNSKATLEWLNSKKQNTKWQYQNRFEIWLEYCRLKGIPSNGSEQLEDIKKRRLSSDNTTKYFYDNEVPKFFLWLQKEYKGETTNKPLSESSALAVTTAIRSFFAYHRYSLEIRKDALPSSEKVKRTYKDHRFDIYQLRELFKRGNLQERTVLACGKDLWLRAGDFVKLNREMIELLIKREQETAQNENRDIDVIEFELISEKEKEPCSCHLSRETIQLLKDYLKTYPKKNDHLFPITEDALNDLLRRLAKKSKITKTGRIRWHCLRKFGITLMHGKITEPVMKYMTGKHISSDLRTYIQNNHETLKAFKLIEPLISLTKQNGNGANQKLAEELKMAKLEIKLLKEFIEELTTPEQRQHILNKMFKTYGVQPKLERKRPELEPIDVTRKETQPLPLENELTDLANLIMQKQQKDLDRILAENNNNH
jgi:integrase